jgi:hypothetical protein
VLWVWYDKDNKKIKTMKVIPARMVLLSRSNYIPQLSRWKEWVGIWTKRAVNAKIPD